MASGFGRRQAWERLRRASTAYRVLVFYGKGPAGGACCTEQVDAMFGILKNTLTNTRGGYIMQIPPVGILAWKVFHMEEQKCCCHKTKERTEDEYKRLIHRLNRVEGQIRGIRGMVEKNVYCTEILAQVAAANAALNAFSKELLSEHIRTCVAQDIREGKDETIDELLATLQRLMK